MDADAQAIYHHQILVQTDASGEMSGVVEHARRLLRDVALSGSALEAQPPAGELTPAGDIRGVHVGLTNQADPLR